MPYKEEALIDEDNDYLNNIRRSYFQARKEVSQKGYIKDKSETQYRKCVRELETFVKYHNRLRISSMDDTERLIDLFFPEREIVNLFECYGEDEEKEVINAWYITNIFRIAESLLTFRDGKIAIRTWINKENPKGLRDIFDHYDSFNKVEIWNLLSRMVVPDVFVAAFYVECGWTDKEDLYNQVGNVSLADKELDIILKKGLAETHMHFNAGIAYPTLWEEFTNPYIWAEKIKNRKIADVLAESCNKWALHMIIYRVIMAEYLQRENEKEDLCKFIEKSYGDLSGKIYRAFHEFKSGKTYDIKEIIGLFSQLVDIWKINYKMPEDARDFLYESVYETDVIYSPTAEIFFQIQVLKELRENEQNIHERHLFMQYLRIKNLYFEKIMQSGNIIGFKNFQRYYSQAARWSDNSALTRKKRIRAIFESQVQNTNLKKMEIRIGPQTFLDEDHFSKPDDKVKKDMKQNILTITVEILQEYQNCIQNFLDKNGVEEPDPSYIDLFCEQGVISVPTMGIIFNFIRSDYLDNRLGNTCWIQKTEGSYVYNKHILTYRKQMVLCAKAIEELRSELPLLNEYIVGIDAASEEFASEPWVLAPVYCAIRNRKITKPVLKGKDGEYKRIQNIGFTYHVGEEYRHLLSGFRYVDEVLERFGYKAGDRIGHAIALGVNIDYWIERNEVVAIPINEYMEDLIWLWGCSVYEKIRLSVPMEIIEGKILELAQKIYGNIQGMTVFMLYQAYNEKFKESHDKLFEEMSGQLKEVPEEEEHFCKYYDSSKKWGSMWTKEKIVCTYFCPIYWQKFREPILVPVKKEDANLYKEIQKQLIQKIEKTGVYVETNPTSNSVLGEIPGILCHHVLNLNSIDREKKEGNSVLVTINSDDPVVFNTNSENEMAYIYYALLHNGYKKEEVLEWIDKVRQSGIDSSFIKKVKKPSEQMKEMQELIEIIDEYLKHPN